MQPYLWRGKIMTASETEVHTRNVPSHARTVSHTLPLDGGVLVYSQTQTGYVFATLFPADKAAAWAVECGVAARAGLNMVRPDSDIVERALAALPVVESLPHGKRVHLMAPNGECVAQA